VTKPHWRVVIDDRARKDLRQVDPPNRKRILAAITKLGQSAELTGDIKRLKGSSEYRLRVGDWRVRFERDGHQLIITVVRVLPRGRAYDR
jgi:mRNA interferase RelE/StbE